MARLRQRVGNLRTQGNVSSGAVSAASVKAAYAAQIFDGGGEVWVLPSHVAGGLVTWGGNTTTRVDGTGTGLLFRQDVMDALVAPGTPAQTACSVVGHEGGHMVLNAAGMENIDAQHAVINPLNTRWRC
jgi:hypothetical protein